MARQYPKVICCEALAHSFESGTDNEGYSNLIRCYEDEFHIGCDNPALKFCPWCGKEFVSEFILKER
jgi:hypothetical protein